MWRDGWKLGMAHLLFTVLAVLAAWLPETALADGKDGPEIHQEPIGAQGEVELEVDPVQHVLTVYVRGEVYKQYPIALGKQETPTPVGDYVVINKYKNWAEWFGTRWIGLNVMWGTYGIHGTNRPESIGKHASHGCIRMLNRDVEELYEMVRIGTKVRILGHVLGEPDQEPRRLAKGHIGADVMLIQNRLHAMGYFHGVINGKFGERTERAMKRFEKDNQLQIDGVVGIKDYMALGLIE